MPFSFNKIAPILYLLSVFATLSVSAENYVKLSQFNTENGLTQNSIIGITQDNEGYLWVGTSEGVNRYDGYRMSTLTSPNNVLAVNPIELIWQDSAGLIWIGASPKNNYILDKKNDKLTPIQLEAPNDYKLEYAVFNKIIENSNQDLWISTFRELYFFDRRKNKFEFTLSIAELFDDPDEKHIFRDLLLVDEFLLIATSNGLYSFNLQTNQINLIKHTPAAPLTEDQYNVKKLHLNKDNQLFIGTVEGLYMINSQFLRTASDAYLGEILASDLNIWQIIEKPNFYWLATDKGLFKLNRNSKSNRGNNLTFVFRFSDTPFNTSDDDIVSMIEDREGNLWFGTQSDGLFKWHPNAAIKKHLWTKSESDSRLSDDMVLDIHQSSQETFWIATNNGLNKYNQKTDSNTRFLVNNDEKEILSASTIYSVTSNKGKLWLNTFDGIQVFDQNTFRQEQILFPKTNKNIFSGDAIQLYFLTQDNLAIVMPDGIYNYSLSENKVSLIESTQKNGDELMVFYDFFDTATGNDDEFFISGPDRLWKYSRDTNLVRVFHQLPGKGVHNTNAAGLYRAKDKLWVTYPGYGIYLLDATSGKEIYFISEQSINANTMMDIFPDKKNNIWVTSNEGLLRINQTDFRVTKFDSNDGFRTSEFNQNTTVPLENGEVYLGSVKGVFRIDPNQLTSETNSEIKIHINKVSLLSKPLESQYSDFDDSQIELSYNDFGLKIEFSALLLNKPNQVKYQYWVEGDTNIEKTSINDSELFFPSFDVGQSQLYISAIGYHSGLESKPVSLSIVSYPAPWFSRAAIFSYLVLSLLVVSFTWIRYRKKVLAKEQSHQRIKRSEERLSLALKGGNSGLWDWHSENNLVYEPRMVESGNKNTNKEKIVSFKERLAAIHFRDQNNVLSTWRAFLRGENKVFDVTYRIQNAKLEWQWYRDIAMVSEYNQQKNPIRVTGTYTNITERKEATEQIRLYSKAFENSRDIIVILNSNKKIIAVNKAFHTLLDYPVEVVMNRNLEAFVTSQSNRDLVLDIFTEIERNNHWEGEAQIVKENTEKIPVLVNATTFMGNDSNQHFVFSISDIGKQKSAESELKKLVNYDALTNLPNRTLLLEYISHAIKHCKRYDKQLAVFFVDLDRFKQINDTLGHDIGDLLLIKSANILTSTIREDDTVARIGGDEFVVMLEDIVSITSINRIAQDILRKMKAPVSLNDHQVTISASIGISIYPQDASDAATLLKHADIAMYHAKNDGRNNFQYFEDFMNRAAKHRLDIENKLRLAVENKEFYLVYQPLYDIGSGQFCGVEALARWKTRTGEIISPDKFIPVAEDLGLIKPMAEHLLQSAMENLVKWNESMEPFTLAFNLSACHIYDPGFLLFIENIVKKYSSVIHLLEFELTEGILMEDTEKARRIFEKLDEMGIDLALDDFGTGYSSLKYLTQLPIDKLKIDMSFVSKIGLSVENDAIIQTIIGLAKSLNLKTVAEGIETTEQFEFLKQANVNYAQGRLFSRPLEIQDLEKILVPQSGPVKLS